jgi:uncharacterized membrane protein
VIQDSTIDSSRNTSGPVTTTRSQDEIEAPSREATTGNPRPMVEVGAVALIAILSVVLAGSPPILRTPFGVLAVLVLPGYALTTVLFPTDEQLTLPERVSLSLGMSLSIIAVGALLLDRLAGGLGPVTIRLALCATTLALLGGGLVRRRAIVPPVERPVPANRPGPSRAVRFTQALVVTSVIAAAVSYAATIGDRPPDPTEFYALGDTNSVSRYPRDVNVGQPVTVRLGIHQVATAIGNYTIRIESNDVTLATVGPLSISPGKNWEDDATFAMPTVGDDREVLLRLFPDGASRPTRTLRLWLNVRAADQTG